MDLLFRPKHKIIYIRLSEFSNARISFVFPLERLPHWIKKIRLAFTTTLLGYYWVSNI